MDEVRLLSMANYKYRHEYALHSTKIPRKVTTMTDSKTIKDASEYNHTLADLYADAAAFGGEIVSDDTDGHHRSIVLYDGENANFYIEIEEIMDKFDGPVQVEYVAEKTYEWYATTFNGSRFATVECPVPKVLPQTVTVPRKAYASKNPMNILSTRKALDYYGSLRSFRQLLVDTVAFIDIYELKDFDCNMVYGLHKRIQVADNELQRMRGFLVDALDRESTEEVQA